MCAKIKIKGEFEFIPVPDADLLAVKAKIEAGELSKDSYVTLGNFYGKLDSITAFLLSNPGAISDSGQKQFGKYILERKIKLAEKPEIALERNRGFYSFCSYCFEWKGVWNSVVEKTKEWLAGHPYRLWCDPLLWAENENREGVVNQYKGFGLSFIEMVIRNDMAEEEEEIGRINSLRQ